MLRKLIVRRLAVIEDVQVEFADGLNVLSGETGAGKSILVTAIGLALGWRATSDLIRTGCDDAEVVAEFEAAGEEARSVLAELGIEAGEKFQVRRIIQAAGRNRVLVAGKETTLATLRRFGETMLNLYGQHEAQGLMRPESHLLYLDEYAGLAADRQGVANLVASLKEVVAALARLEKQEAEREARLGYLRFVSDEITAANVQPGEDEELENRIKVLANAESLIHTGRLICDVLYDRDEGSVAEEAGELLREVAGKVDLDSRLADLRQGLEELVALAEDLAARGRDYGESLEFDPAQLAELEDRLHLLRDLKKKYGGTLAEVLAAKENAEREIADLDKLTTDIQALATERQKVREQLTAAATGLSRARAKAAKKMEREVVAELGDLDMPGTRFVVSIEPLVAGGVELGELRVDDTGADQVEFLISPNVGELPRPLVRIASGGELSRIMLAIKRVLSRHFPVPTLIFDEIDAGVGGAQAERLGRKLCEVAGEHQVLCITHLPQIAAQADHHFLVLKTTEKGRTRTYVKPLSPEERVEEVARMLGGETITAEARANAEALLTGSQARQ